VKKCPSSSVELAVHIRGLIETNQTEFALEILSGIPSTALASVPPKIKEDQEAQLFFKEGCLDARTALIRAVLSCLDDKRSVDGHKLITTIAHDDCRQYCEAQLFHKEKKEAEAMMALRAITSPLLQKSLVTSCFASDQGLTIEVLKNLVESGKIQEALDWTDTPLFPENSTLRWAVSGFGPTFRVTAKDIIASTLIRLNQVDEAKKVIVLLPQNMQNTYAKQTAAA
jgi:hypothetical protein